jgi:hypothetical protein
MALLAWLALGFRPHAQRPRPADLDRDGWLTVEGDCEDRPTSTLAFPERVNPGAYEVPGNGIDNDCNGILDDEPPALCSFAPLLVAGALDLAAALDLCQSTTAAKGRWGLISAELLRADGLTVPHAFQSSVKASFGGYLPRKGFTFAVLSSGIARTTSDPGFTAPGPCSGGSTGGTAHATTGLPMPAAWLAENGGVPPGDPLCPPAFALAFDSVLLRLRLRVPTNATHVRFQHAFLTSEWPNTCTANNDTALLLVTAGAAPSVPSDGNVLLGPTGAPLTVQTAVYEFCGSPSCPSNAPLFGSGFSPSEDAGTAWHESAVRVVPGSETLLEFHLWDGHDPHCDSTLLLDGMTWDLLP